MFLNGRLCSGFDTERALVVNSEAGLAGRFLTASRKASTGVGSSDRRQGEPL